MELAELEGYELAGRFKLGQLLGQGGYGAVFEAEQISMGRRCAVKILAPHLCSDSSTKVRFEREARATSRLTHPNTVVIYDFGKDEEKDVVFLAMEFLDGRDLNDVLDADGFLELETALHITRQASESLYEAHGRGLVHRDIKPHNLMLTERGKDPNFVKVIDFGIAKVVQDVRQTALTQTGTIIGTPRYMSPEQVRDDELDGRSDQYSLAICVYAMLTGRTPFVGSSPIDTATKHLIEDPLPIRTFHPSLPVEKPFEDALLKALSKQKEDRFADTIEFANALIDAAGTARGNVRRTQKTQAVGALPPEKTTEPMQEPPATVDQSLPTGEEAETVSHDGGGAETVGGEDADVASEGTTAAATQPDTSGTDAAPEFGPGGTLAVDIDAEDYAPPSHPDSTGFGTGTAEIADVPDEQPDSSREEGSGRSLKALAAIAVVAVAALLAGAMVVAVMGRDSGKEDREAGVVEGADDDDSPPSVSEEKQKRAPAADEEKSRAAVDVPDESAERAESDEAVEAAVAEESEEAEEAEAEDDNPVEASNDPETAGESSSADDARENANDEEKTKEDREVRHGKIQVSIMPWGTLYVGGRKYGDRPVQTIRLAEGRHTLVLKQNGAVRDRKKVDVDPGETKMVKLIAR